METLINEQFFCTCLNGVEEKWLYGIFLQKNPTKKQFLHFKYVSQVNQLMWISYEIEKSEKKLFANKN